eukprot:359416-Chlamydomonas_euryale.AAC.11
MTGLLPQGEGPLRDPLVKSPGLTATLVISYVNWLLGITHYSPKFVCRAENSKSLPNLYFDCECHCVHWSLGRAL